MSGNAFMNFPNSGTIPDRLLYKVPEVAHLLGGVTERYVWTLLERGDLRSVKIGRLRLVKREDLQSFIAGLAADHDKTQDPAAAAGTA
jgi:excisionase family DNA binding protein